MSVVLLVRHGQASFGAEEYDKLSEVGLEQARVVGETLRERVTRVHAVFSGTLLRHVQTAEACLSELDEVPEMRRTKALNEFDHDEILARLDPRFADRMQLAAEVMSQENPRQALQELFVRAVARWTSGEHDADYTESWPGFRQRCVAALEEVTRSLASAETALVFTSGGPITAICQELLGLPDHEAFRVSWSLVNCGITKVLYTPRGLRLSTLNEHAHFEGARRALITYR